MPHVMTMHGLYPLGCTQNDLIFFMIVLDSFLMLGQIAVRAELHH